jgi:hypothetical protein
MCRFEPSQKPGEERSLGVSSDISASSRFSKTPGEDEPADSESNKADLTELLVTPQNFERSSNTVGQMALPS